MIEWSLTPLIWTSVGASAALGAVGSYSGVGGRLLSAGVSKLPANAKGWIGEKVARAGIALTPGEKYIGTKIAAGSFGATGRAAKAVPDFIVKRGSTIGYVEAKFGKSSLSGAQRALRDQVGDDVFRVSRTSYDDVATFGNHLGAAAAGATGGAVTRSYK